MAVSDETETLDCISDYFLEKTNGEENIGQDVLCQFLLDLVLSYSLKGSELVRNGNLKNCNFTW